MIVNFLFRLTLFLEFYGSDYASTHDYAGDSLSLDCVFAALSPSGFAAVNTLLTRPSTLAS